MYYARRLRATGADAEFAVISTITPAIASGSSTADNWLMSQPAPQNNSPNNASSTPAASAVSENQSVRAWRCVGGGKLM